MIEATTFGDQPFDEMIWAALTMLAFAIGHLPPNEREATLQEFEDGRVLRQAVQRFLNFI